MLHIATAVDHAYLLPLRIMIASLLEQLRPSCVPVLHVINRNLDRAELESISSSIRTNSIVPDARVLRSLPRQRGFVPEAAFPLFLPDLLPASVDRVLFLDPDLLVLDDVATIWETDLRERVLAAVTDQAIPLCSSPRGVKDRPSLGIPDIAPYFNAGVMLIDVERWKRDEVTSRACDYIDRHRARLDFLHQEALNALLWDEWLQLDHRWNVIASLAGRDFGPYKSESIGNPGIVHFAGYFKPWRFRVGGPFAGSYDRFASRFTGDHTTLRPSLSEQLLSFYDRRARQYFYGFERMLWNQRLI